jgi:hypothetical protein
MRFDGKKIELLKTKYPVGTVVVVLAMNDPHGVPSGTKGIVDHIDDIGQIHVSWDNGSGLALIPDEDEFRIDYADLRNMEVTVDSDSLVTDEEDEKNVMCFISYSIKDRLNRYNLPDPVSASGIYLFSCSKDLTSPLIVDLGKKLIEQNVSTLINNPLISATPNWFQFLYRCLVDSDNNMAFSNDYGIEEYLNEISNEVSAFLKDHDLIGNGSVSIYEDAYLTIYPSILNFFNMKNWDSTKIDHSFIPDEAESDEEISL